MDLNFTRLSRAADVALNYLTEGKRLAGELFSNYEEAKATLSTNEKEQLEAKLDQVREKSAEVHEEIQQQD